MIQRIRIKGYKSLDGVDVRLSPLTLVFGPNAAGKSNLLDALALLSRMASSENLDVAFASHRGTPLEAFTLPEGGVEALERVRRASFTFTADVRLSDAVVEAVESEIRRAREGLTNGEQRPSRPASIRERFLRYTVTVEIMTSSGHLRVIDEKLEALKEDGTRRASRKPFLERVAKHNRILVRMEKQGHPNFEEVGQDRTIVSKPLYPPHYPHMVAFREELARWRFYFLDPSMMREEVPLKDVEALSPNGSDVAAFYNSLKHRSDLQFKAMGKALRQVIPGIVGVDVDRTKQGFLRLELDEEGLPLSSRLVSEGTLRVLGLLAITNPIEPMSVVGLEEPENGVHPRRLEIVARILIEAAERGTSQFIVNSHSPVLPEYFLDYRRAQLIQCRREGRRSVFQPFDSLGPLFDKSKIEAALDEGPTSFRDRLVRGDFGG